MTSSNGNNNQPAQQPPWITPQTSTAADAFPTGLRLNNSLTKQKNDFVAQSGKRVSWYCCGPTVYDAAHMGHARSYLTFDIMRRVMEDYFGYSVNYVMNITDIDDKIILRARQNHLFEQYKQQYAEKLTPSLIGELKDYFAAYIQSKLVSKSPALASAVSTPALDNWPAFVAAVEQNQSKISEEVGEKFPMYWLLVQNVQKALTVAHARLEKGGDSGPSAAAELIQASKDIIAEAVDKQLGHSVTKHEIFQELASHWEQEFMKDMKALNIKPPSFVTRVSEYVPEIIHFVSTIIKNGYGYATEDGSVYFDVQAFKQRHDYAKLSPWSAGHTGLLEEGEGSLGASLRGKKSPHDFALWKASKPGEPFWVSPWGNGRPGWHIECSAMASDILGECMDIHSGGIDLCFPHHDNEMAQSEAYYGNRQWVNYFLHAGHLHIAGQKMSKSLKNFITIAESLQKYPASQIRTMILMSQWDSVLDYKDETMSQAGVLEATFRNFMESVKSYLRERDQVLRDASGVLTHSFKDKEKTLLSLLEKKQQSIHRALQDNMNTPMVMNELLELVSKTNVYIKDQNAAKQPINKLIIREIAMYLTKMLKVFGVVEERGQEIGYAHADSGGGSNALQNKEEMILPLVQDVSSFRDQVRSLALTNAEKSDYLVLCDQLRDDVLPNHGILLTDRDVTTGALVQLLPPDVIRAQNEEKKRQEEEKRRRKQEAEAERIKKQLERLEKGRVEPRQMFQDTAQYSRWDEEGIPTHDQAGEELAKSRRKKLQKEFATQQKLHAEFLEAKQSGHIN